MFSPVYLTLPEAKQGKITIDHFEMTSVDCFNALIRQLTNNDISSTPVPGKYTRLVVDGILMMTDTPMEMESNHEFVSNAKGDVLIFGLGIGMILPSVLEKPEVTSVLVIELEKDVVDLVLPHYQHPKLTVLQGDAFIWTPPEGAKFDTIYWDIWPERTSSNLSQMLTLHRRGIHWLRDKDSWQESWYRKELLDNELLHRDYLLSVLQKAYVRTITTMPSLTKSLHKRLKLTYGNNDADTTEFMNLLNDQWHETQARLRVIWPHQTY